MDGTNRGFLNKAAAEAAAKGQGALGDKRSLVSQPSPPSPLPSATAEPLASGPASSNLFLDICKTTQALTTVILLWLLCCCCLLISLV